MDEISYEPIEAETPAAVITVDRAVGDLRRGGAVVLGDGDGASLVLSSEYASTARLQRLAAEVERRWGSLEAQDKEATSDTPSTDISG